MSEPVIFKTIDGRVMVPPEPMVQTLDALEHLPDGQHLRLLLGREPWPLYSMLQSSGYDHQTGFFEDDGFEILIWRRAG